MTQATDRQERLALSGIVKRFGTFSANDEVALSVKTGSVHAILGENGAGKSTLMNIIYGLYQPDEGTILVNGWEERISSPRHALELGIGMVHQHFKQVETMTVVENIVIGLPGHGLLDLGRHRARIVELAAELGFEIDPDQEVWRLPVGMQQRVEILKLLYRNADLLILDEPTSVLTPSEVGPFFSLLRKLKDSGRTIILITHKFDEVLSMADDITVMRASRVVATRQTSQTDARELARLMVGRDITSELVRKPVTPGRVMLKVSDLRVVSERGVAAVDGVSIDVRQGEILGLAGVDGNGQKELAEAIGGVRPSSGGTIEVGGTDVRDFDPSARKNVLRMGFVPEDRQRMGLDLDSNVAMNMVLRSFRAKPFATAGWMNFGAIERHAINLAERYDVRMRGINQNARDLSGGNQQKIILAREIEDEPDVLVVAQPTKGLDIGAIEFVQKTLLAQRERGCAILYISTELEDLLQVADRVAVISKGKITGVIPRSEASSQRLGLMMAGMAQ